MDEATEPGLDGALLATEDREGDCVGARIWLIPSCNVEFRRGEGLTFGGGITNEAASEA